MNSIREFFRNDHPFVAFKEFGFIHMICILFVIITLILIYINRNKISNLKEETKRKILVIGSTILLINMIIYNIAPHLFGYFDYKIHLPFQLCFISGYLFMFGIFFKKESILKITFFLSFIGPIPAILWPDLPSTFDNFNFWKYFISHHIFICLSFFSYFALNYKITLKHAIITFLLVNAMVIIMMPFNYAFQMNYIYSSEIPNNITDLYPWLLNFKPPVILEITGIVIISLLYIVVYFRNKELYKKKLSMS